MFITDSIVGDLLTLIVTISVIVVWRLQRSFQYWKRRNVPYLEPRLPWGNLKHKEHKAVTLKSIYDEMKSRGWKHGGIYVFTKPNYFVLDLDIVRNILTKDFQYFVDRPVFSNADKPLQAHLLNMKGAKWRSLRSKLTPTFTSGKMKMMFGIMADCQEDLKKRLDKECEKKEPIDIKELLACFTTNIIGSCAFGLDFKALEDEDSAFRVIGREMFKPSFWKIFGHMFTASFPKVAKALKLNFGSKKVTEFLSKLVKDTVEYREKNNYTRNDFMQLLINLKNEEDKEKSITMNELGSQAVVFFGAGFETSSTLMTFALYELAKHQDIQDRLRKEIKTTLAKHENKITYDSIQDITYLTQVIDETLRIHPPGASLSRQCVKDYKVPNQDLIIEEGMIVSISILGIHLDKDIYPNPEKFDPDRFNEENRKLRHNFAFLPFGEGPRNCIGMRFGLLQSKVGLASLIKDYRFTINKKTKEPISYNPGSLVLSIEGELWLNAERV